MNMSDAFQKAYHNSGKPMPQSSRPPQQRPAGPEQSGPLKPPMSLPANFVDEAERVMLAISKPGKDDKLQFGITTSKIRNLLSLAIEVYHREYLRTEPKLLEESLYQIQMMRVRMLYEGGREPAVKTFLDRSHLICYLKDIGEDRMKLIRFTQYLEALVAYHRYFGGREN